MRVLILRPREQLKETLEKFKMEGFETYGCPFIEIEFLDFEVPEHDYAIVTSQNAAKAIVERKIKLKNVIAIGEKTAKALNQKALIPKNFNSKSLVEEFKDVVKGKKVVAIRSDKGGDELRELSKFCNFSEVVAYRTKKLNGDEQKRVVKLTEDCFFNVIVFSSKMIAESFLDLCDPEVLKKKIVVAIGEPTAQYLKNFSIEALKPKESTFESVLDLLKSIKQV
ncbi:MAG: uroporphyrinogen-III synthase [Archaeoglobaceae archaeon]|nr:uroporphyrinogen-III synthase [Archaeoglobaceae archaeon]MCX8152101.1 uroporphyrinogen-III synthase [Archaeoglobaceae archaeon]MDW8013536.1 uroporphyrinogen-III synthase [Archaeoglobaceae archaeon]